MLVYTRHSYKLSPRDEMLLSTQTLKCRISMACLGSAFMLQTSLSLASSLAEIGQIAETGAAQLAIRMLEQEQDGLLEKPQQWMNWERKRIQLYEQNNHWQKSAERLEKLPKLVNVSFMLWAKGQRAKALIYLNQSTLARRELRTLIWQVEPDKITEKQMTSWRELIIESYLAEGYANDAQIASMRLRQINKKENIASIMQRARIAILNKQTKEAINLLKPHAEKIEVAPLMLIAQLRGQHRAAKSVLQAAHRYLRDQKIKLELKVNLWAVAAEAAKQNGNRKVVANASEHVLADKHNLTLAKSIYTINSDALWNAYIDYALLLGNQEQLLIGEDKKWITAANKISTKRPVGARAMYVFIMLRGQTANARQQASEQFVELLGKRKHGNRILVELFQNSRHFKKTEAIPSAVRHALVDVALSNSDIDRASELMATIEAPPAGADQFMWKLRRARILILGTQAEVGGRAVLAILDENKSLSQEQIDKLLQVVFDLQTAGQHESAYVNFEKALPQIKDDQIKREIYYWMADSRKAQERYADAAQLYLKSALYPDPENMDPWAQTAHYQAAESLARASLYKDAEVLFDRLLKVTEDPARRAALKRELHRLWAMQ